MITFTLNGSKTSYDGDPDMPLLWFVREQAGLSGTKYGCGVALCGACTVHLDGAPARSCSTPMATVEGASVTTIEGLETPEGRAVQEAWRELDVVQCGYCQSGQIMTAAALLAETPAPSEDDITNAMDGNLCRCATYQRIRAGVRKAAETMKG